VAVDGMSLDQRYVLTGALWWRNLDGQWLVHFSASGATLTADAVDAALLEWLSDGPTTGKGLASRLAAASGTELPSDTDKGIDARLQAWLQHGWVDLMDG
jgi:hypothetical protein